jgi:uncharacterized membrane protein
VAGWLRQDWLQADWLWAIGGFAVGAFLFGLRRRKGEARSGDGPGAGTLEERIHALGQRQRAVLERLLRHDRALRDPNESFDEKLTFGQRAADRIATWGGSWTFILLFLAFLSAWIAFNARSAGRFDPFPFILLNLILSCLAALQAPVIMMSQNRQSAKDRHDAHLDYETNVHAELEIQALQSKVDLLQDQQWVELMRLQERQIELLERIVTAER